MSFISKISRKKLEEKILPYASDLKTLEVGAYGSPSYSKYFSNRIGIDIRQGPGVDIVASAYEMPFKDGEFDIVVCVAVLEHFDDPHRAIAEIYRVLKPGGRIIISVPFLFPIHDAPGDYWRFTKYGLAKMFERGWYIQELSAETNINEAFAVLLQRIGYQVNFRFNKFFKVLIFGLAWVLMHAPRLTKKVYGEIQKKREEPDAFTSSFFLVAKKSLLGHERH